MIRDLQNNSNTIDELQNFLLENLDKIYTYFNKNTLELLPDVHYIEDFILERVDILKNLDFSFTQNKAFISLLCDITEKLSLVFQFSVLFRIIIKYNINLTNRLYASKEFLIGINEKQDYINRFDSICNFLKSAINEEDNIVKPLITFANYYKKVLRDTNPLYFEQLRTKIFYEQTNTNFPFLNDDFIASLINVNTENIDAALQEIDELIDNLKLKYKIIIPERNYQLLIENKGKYFELLSNTEKNFNSVLNLSRNLYNSDYDLNNRGINIIKREEEMIAYLRRFGNMHKAKLDTAFKELNFDEININKDVEIYDWACGQALAIMVFADFIREKNINLNINKITLIEPSEICIKRAALHTSHFFDNIQIETICKDIDSLNNDDFIINSNSIKFHLFSNIIDIEEFDLFDIYNLIKETQIGLNYFICVSPYITDARAYRLESFMEYFQYDYHNDFYKIFEIETGKLDKYWNCNSNFKGYRHNNHPNFCNGKNKWTRIIKVFKVTL